MNEELKKWRDGIDSIDREIIQRLNWRFKYCEEIGKIKKANGIENVQDPKREEEIISKLSALEKYPGMVETLWPIIMNFSRELQKKDN